MSQENNIENSLIVNKNQVVNKETKYDNILAGLGIQGWSHIEEVLFTGILLGEPFCLISEPGAAKTYFAEVIASALGDNYKYGYYDLSKSNFEDFIGFPNPESFKAGKAEFIQNEITIWDKNVIMIDEVSRALMETSNKWLEITGSRKLMGRNLPLRVVMAAMNPVEHNGTHPLDQAFADRFLLFINLPKFINMSQDERDAILSGSTGLDAPSIDFWETEKEINTKVDYVIKSEEFTKHSILFKELLANSAKVYKAFSETEKDEVSKYVDYFAKAVFKANKKVSLEPRRLKMIKRAILGAFSIKMAKQGTSLTANQKIEIANFITSCSLPNPYTGSEFITLAQLQSAQIIAQRIFENNQDEVELLNSDNYALQFAKILENDYSDSIKEKIVNNFVETKNLNADMTALVLANFLVKDNISEKLSVSLVDKLVKRYKEVKLSNKFSVNMPVDKNLIEDKKQLDKINNLIKEANNNTNKLLACGWAIAHCKNINNFEGLYNKALNEITQVNKTLYPLANKWNILKKESDQDLVINNEAEEKELDKKNLNSLVIENQDNDNKEWDEDKVKKSLEEKTKENLKKVSSSRKRTHSKGSTYSSKKKSSSRYKGNSKKKFL